MLNFFEGLYNCFFFFSKQSLNQPSANGKEVYPDASGFNRRFLAASQIPIYRESFPTARSPKY